ncbi:MAG: carbon starvation protein A [Oscillospiraceae bacterium]|nr:carbon starvation protein A [Oscillospiraceae bacterium]
MNGITIMLIALIVLGAGYLLYGRWLAKTWGIDPKAKTPAYEMEDGVDYTPTSPGVVFGHQFASIAGAGPINGPIQAAIFGWVPVLLWVLVGGLFFGAVQDFVSMFASVRNKGRTIGYIIELYIGKIGKKLFTLFVWLFSILVVAAFADVVANTFNGFAATPEVSLANGQVATTSMLFILAAVTLGVVLKVCRFKPLVNTVIAVGLLALCIVLGMVLPMYVPTSTWHLIVFVYIAIASIVPVWALLQPRDYLNSYLLVAMIVAAVAGVFIANPQMNLNAFNGFTVNGQHMFPILFVTIACGAVSGFHSLVSSGTASKQVQNEKHMLPISFGSMLLESLLAVIALIAVGAVSSGAQVASGTPAVVFATAISGFLGKIGIPQDVAFTLINLSVSAFALTSLDSVARVGRLAFQEFFLDSTDTDENMSPVKKFLTNKYTATVATLVMAYALAKAGYANIWPLFGSANQLLSALALIACAVFLKRTNRKGWMLWAPMGIMLAVTLTALGMTIFGKFGGIFAGTTANLGGDLLQGSFAVALFVLGVIVAVQGVKKLFGKETAEEAVQG